MVLAHMNNKYVDFESLSLQNYGVFQGKNHFEFNPHRTVIVIGNGMGKTTLKNALAYLGYSPDIKPYLDSQVLPAYSTVVTKGERSLIEKYRDLIFFDADIYANISEITISKDYSKLERKELTKNTRLIFETLLKDKPHKIRAHQDLSFDNMATGERVCLSFSYWFAKRMITNIRLPIVLESPYGSLDSSTVTALDIFIKNQACQQIILLSDFQYSLISNNEKPDYFLNALTEKRQH